MTLRMAVLHFWNSTYGSVIQKVTKNRKQNMPLCADNTNNMDETIWTNF